MSQTSTVQTAISEMIASYHEVNGFDSGASGLFQAHPDRSTFETHVAKNLPFVVRNAIIEWPAFKLWDASYLRKKMGDSLVKIAETPGGNADAVATRPEDHLQYLVKPLETEDRFADFLDTLRSASKDKNSTLRRSVRYSQAQNDNLRSEYRSLQEDVPVSISGMTAALDREPDAINLWLGNESSITALHRDDYENVYTQIRGSKTFILLPPVECACVNEQFLPFGTYATPDDWSIVPDIPEIRAPVALWDPDKPEVNATRFSKLSKPLRVKLEAGDLLYLPACWYHKVTQSNGPEGFCCSVNYWYDMSYDGPFYTYDSYIRSMAWAANSM